MVQAFVPTGSSLDDHGQAISSVGTQLTICKGHVKKFATDGMMVRLRASLYRTVRVVLGQSIPTAARSYSGARVWVRIRNPEATSHEQANLRRIS